MLVQEPIHAAIWHCLNHYAYGDATFLAERLFAEVHSDESLHLLATCYYRAGKLGQAYDILSKNDAKTPQNRFLMAKCCADMNKTHEAEHLLEGNILDPKGKDHLDDLVGIFGDAACFALQILAKIYASTERLAKSVDAEKKALKLNPLLWKSFEALCQRGDFPDPNKVFTVDKLDNLSQCQGLNPILSYANRSCAPAQPVSSVAASRQPATLATPTYSYGGCSSTSTPILPVSNVQLVQQHQPPPPGQPTFMTMITPVPQLALPVPNMEMSIGSDSCFTGSPMSEAPSKLAMSGIGALNFSSDCDTSMVGPSTTGRNNAMPPPLRPKLLRKVGEQGPSHFGRLPRGALVWASGNNRSESLLNPLCGSKLDFSPLSVLSPCSLNPPSTPVQSAHASTSTAMGSDQQPPSGINPLIEAKLKRSQIENNSPLKQQFSFGQTTNQNTPANNNSGGSAVRRSSRLFGSTQQQSIKSKENTKTPVTTASVGGPAAPKTSRSLKSPSKKSVKSRAKASPPGTTSGSDQQPPNEAKKKVPAVGDSDIENSGPANLVVLTAASPASPLEAQQLVGGQAFSLQKQSIEGLMHLLRHLGSAYVELSRYNSRKALACLEDLVPAHHRNTGWVQGLLGTAHFELGEYRAAKRCFANARDLDPHRTDFVDYHSTALWHLQEEVELSALAQDATRIDKMSPQAWCAAGNCFSLQKEHENAIKFFHRAAQVDPTFAYAYTLLGHEYITMEELEKALSCFRTAVRMDPRHYNAWYGIGLVYYKQERFQLAEMYYRKALAINTQSPILMCHVAVVQHALTKVDKALETLDAALKSAPTNPLCKFERASILLSSDRHAEALEELNDLKVLVPKESPVYFLMGKVHNKMNNTHLALMHFSWAMDLDPKGANSQIKDALDRSMNRAAQEDAEVSNNDETNTTAGQVHDEDDNDEDEMMQEDSQMASNSLVF